MTRTAAWLWLTSAWIGALFLAGVAVHWRSPGYAVVALGGFVLGIAWYRHPLSFNVAPEDLDRDPPKWDRTTSVLNFIGTALLVVGVVLRWAYGL